MKILLFGGTTEGRVLSKKLNELNHEVVVCVTSEIGEAELKEIGVKVLVGKLLIDDIRKMISCYDLCIDATHPFAEHISNTLKIVCSENNIPLKRIIRDPILVDNCIFVSSQSEAAKVLSKTVGNVLLTTGVKELKVYSELNRERLFVRTLPSIESLKTCAEQNILHKNIIAMYGPFSYKMNVATFEQYNIKFVLTKESGASGGFAEKLQAAKDLSITTIVIERPKEIGLTIEQLLEELAREQK